MKAIHNINTEEYENAVLGSILIDPKVMDSLSTDINADDFYKTANKKLYSLLAKMHELGNPIDLMTVYEFAREQRLDSAIGGTQRLIYLTETTPCSANFKYYADKVLEASQKTKILTEISLVYKGISNGTISGNDAGIRLNKIDAYRSEHSGLVPVSAHDLQESAQPVQSLWGEMLYPACITQINSEPGVGKTTFVYNLCITGANGGSFLGIPFSGPLKVLNIDVETPVWKRGIKLKTITDGRLPRELYFINTLNLSLQFSELLGLCKKEKYDLVVFDTQSRIFNLEHENDNAEANKMMELLRKLVSDTGCAVVLVHHCSKSDKKGVYSGRGASAIGGAVDVVVNMEALDAETIKLKVDKNRISGDYMTLFIRKTGDDRFEPFVPPTESNSGFEKFIVQDFILSLSSEKINWTTLEIQVKGQLQGYSETTIKRAISNLTQTGKLLKIKRGEYEIAGAEGRVEATLGLVS